MFYKSLSTQVSILSANLFHKYGFHKIAIALATLLTILLLGSPSVWAALPANSAIKDARTILRHALPIENAAIRELETQLEPLPRQTNLKRWSKLNKYADAAISIANLKQESILKDVAPQNAAQAEATLHELQQVLVPLKEAIAAKNRDPIKALTERALEYVGTLEGYMVKQFPYQVPAVYAELPQLQGRAIVEMETTKGSIRMVVDGYNAPVNAGQFVDLVQRGFYNGLEFNRADANYFLQAGDPPGEADGFVDPDTGKVRTVPIEIRVPGKSEPIYGHTLEEVGLERQLPVLPFSAYGTLAMAHPGNDPNGGSSQFFFYLFESDLTPAGLNLIDGNYTVFGYVVDGEDVLNKIRLGDKILAAKTISGAENLLTRQKTAQLPAAFPLIPLLN